MSLTRSEPSSFRDPSARVFYVGDTVRRELAPDGLEAWEALARTRFGPRWTREGRLVATSQLAGEAVLEHERIPFVSYPYCWSFRMLQDAAVLQLDLALDALEEGFTCKDATPYNVQFRGTAPVFIDIPSLVPDANPGAWRPFRQFCEQFLYPLLLSSWKGVHIQARLRGGLEGIPARAAARVLSLRDWLRPGALTHVVLPALMGAVPTTPVLEEGLRSPGLARNTLRGLRKIVAGLKAPRPSSSWMGYAQDCHYADADRVAKQSFVAGAVARGRWNLVWDVGCNRGEYSRMAAPNASYVVAMDSDPDVVDALYLDLRQGGPTNVLPLVQDIADPSPARGWRGLERMRLEDRGRPDLLMCLAVIHHLAISRNIPLAQIVEWAADMGGDFVVELPTPEDPRVAELAQARGGLPPGYSVAGFEAALGERFRVIDRMALPSGKRVLYHARLMG